MRFSYKIALILCIGYSMVLCLDATSQKKITGGDLGKIPRYTVSPEGELILNVSYGQYNDTTGEIGNPWVWGDIQPHTALYQWGRNKDLQSQYDTIRIGKLDTIRNVEWAVYIVHGANGDIPISEGGQGVANITLIYIPPAFDNDMKKLKEEMWLQYYQPGVQDTLDLVAYKREGKRFHAVKYGYVN